MKITDLSRGQLFRCDQEPRRTYVYCGEITNRVVARSVAVLVAGEWTLSIGEDVRWNPYTDVKPLELECEVGMQRRLAARDLCR